MQSLALVAAVFGILAISVDLVAGMLGLCLLGQAGFFAIGAYLTAIAAADYDANPFYLLPVVLLVTTLAGILIGCDFLRVSGLYFAITTFVFTLVLTVLATDLKITRGTQGLLGPTPGFFREPLISLYAGGVVCDDIVAAVLLLASGIRNSPLYPILLSIRDAEPFAQAAGVRTSAIKIGVFGLSAAMAGIAGWLFAFFGVVSPGQFDWAVSLNILVMVLVGGINTTRFLPSGTVISQTLTGKSARGGSFSLKIGPGFCSHLHCQWFAIGSQDRATRVARDDDTNTGVAAWSDELHPSGKCFRIATFRRGRRKQKAANQNHERLKTDQGYGWSWLLGWRRSSAGSNCHFEHSG